MKSCLAFLLLVLCMSSTTCQSPMTRLEGEDSEVLSPRLRFRFDRTPEGADKARSIDVEVMHLSGGFDQELAGLDEVRIEDLSFFGPQVVTADFGLTTASVAWNRELLSVDRFRLDGNIGLGFMNLDMTLIGNEGQDSTNLSSIGPVAGLQVSATLLSDWELYTGMNLLGGIGSDAGGLTTWEVGFHWQFAGAVAIDAGWYSNRIEQGQDDYELSDIEVMLEGPFLRLSFGFGRDPSR